MLSEAEFGGLLFAPIVVYALAALPITLLLRMIMWRIGFMRLVWHLALFEVALYLCVLSLLVLLV
jgi:hypothetical protein